MDINKLCYDVIGAAMKVHQYFGEGYLEEEYKDSLSLQYKHKYRMLSKNPVNPVNHVKKRWGVF